MDIPEGIKDNTRITSRNNKTVPESPSCVVYWMQRSQRAFSNQALNTAVKIANSLSLPLAVLFVLVPDYPGSSDRHYSFMLRGLAETEKSLKEMGAGFFICESDSDVSGTVAGFLKNIGAGLLVGDENPLKVPESWRTKTAESADIPFFTVDSDVVVPSSLFTKEEYSARTLRLKMKPLIGLYLDDSSAENLAIKRDWKYLNNKIRCACSVTDTGKWKKLFSGNIPGPGTVGIVGTGVSDSTGFSGGRSEALSRLSLFTGKKLSCYSDSRNRPEMECTSRLSPYLHFGQIGPAETAAAALKAAENSLASDRRIREGCDSFIEELVVRRELAVNYTKRNSSYDSFDGFHEWAKKTLRFHARDKRPYIYTLRQFESAETHDPLWNACQLEMTETGFMHGYMRMYWAKKILEWTKSPEEAFYIAVCLNDRYELDGRDPNSYTGIAWATGGKHDRPWGPEREIFGLIRYMNYNGMKRKIDISSYISKYGKSNPD